MVAVTMLTDRHPTARPNVYDPRTSHKVGWIPVQKAGLNEGITSERQAVSLLWSVSYKISVVVSAMMTGERGGVGHDPSRGAAYVEAWVAALKEDPREIRRAAADAHKISDFVLARSRERQAEREAAPVAAARSPAPTPRHVQQPEIPLPVPNRSFGPSR